MPAERTQLGLFAERTPAKRIREQKPAERKPSEKKMLLTKGPKATLLPSASRTGSRCNSALTAAAGTCYRWITRHNYAFNLFHLYSLYLNMPVLV